MMEPVNALTTLNLSENLFEHTPLNLPYHCKSNKKNMELHTLESYRFREDYYQMESESGIPIPAYCREVGSYEESDIEILTEEEWMKFPVRPPHIDELKKEISKGKDGEFFAGIRHYRDFGGWPVSEMMQTIDVPELVYKEPEKD